MGIKDLEKILAEKREPEIKNKTEVEDQQDTSEDNDYIPESTSTNTHTETKPKIKPINKPEQFTNIISIPDRSKEVAELKRELDDTKQSLRIIEVKLNNIPNLAVCPRCHDYFNYAMSPNPESERIGFPTLEIKAMFKCSHCNAELAEVEDLVTGISIKAEDFVQDSTENETDQDESENED
jgi:hypothetical protein